MPGLSDCRVTLDRVARGGNLSRERRDGYLDEEESGAGRDFRSFQDGAALTIVRRMTRMQHHIAIDKDAPTGARLFVRPRGLLLLTLR